MKNPPSLETLADKIRELVTTALSRDSELDLESSLMNEQGLDSLDMIEASFAMEDFFGFEFSGRNPIEELDRRIGDNRILKEGVLTAEGRQALFDRMPELAEMELPETLLAAELPQYFNLFTYARLVKDFYDAAPDSCPETGEEVVLDGFRIVSAESRTPVTAPTGDDILERWLDAQNAQVAEA